MNISIRLEKRKILLVILVIILVVGILTLVFVKKYRSGYNDPDFKAYLEMDKYCSGFYGGVKESDQQIYKRWQEKEEIGC